MAVVLSHIILLKVPLFIYHGCACLLQSKLGTASLVQMQDGHFGPEESLLTSKQPFIKLSSVLSFPPSYLTQYF